MQTHAGGWTRVGALKHGTLHAPAHANPRLFPARPLSVSAAPLLKADLIEAALIEHARSAALRVGRTRVRAGVGSAVFAATAAGPAIRDGGVATAVIGGARIWGHRAIAIEFARVRINLGLLIAAAAQPSTSHSEPEHTYD